MEFLSRVGCHLCDDALGAAERVATTMRVPLRVIEIETEDDLLREFGFRIPVVRWSDGTILAEGQIGGWRLLLAALRKRVGG
jgi:hypothetical protein